jgi:hypothetical protein
MRHFKKIILLTITLVLAASASIRAQLLDFSALTAEPQGQLLEIGSAMTFSVNGAPGETFQWLRNGVAIPNQTNSSLTIQNAQISDAGYYSCAITGALQVQSSVTMSLMVYGFSPDSQVVIYGTPITSSGTQGTCPGHYIGYVNYTKTPGNGWGWDPSTNTTVFTATDNNSSNTKVTYLGDYHDSGCAQTSVTIPNPPSSDAYRFTIYFTNNVPTTNYPITLSGFDP